MIYVTGDTHCPIDIDKLEPEQFTEGLGLCKDDYVIICGDAGFCWWGRDDIDREWQQWCQRRTWTTLFIDGNHENHSKLAAMRKTCWNGGEVHRINDSLIHLMRGQVYDIDGKTIFTMGGGTSIDKDRRLPYRSWWPEEMPGTDEYKTAIRNLSSHDWKVDYVLTHEAPSSLLGKMEAGFRYDGLTAFLERVDRKLEYKKWYFGHYHVDMILDRSHTALFERVRLLGL